MISLKRKLLGRFDIFIILALLAAAATFYLRPAAEGVECSVIFKGSEVKTLRLNAAQVFSVPECPGVSFEVRNGAVAFTASDCPDKVCVNTGFIRFQGQSAACLPNGLILKIKAQGDNSDAADAVAY